MTLRLNSFIQLAIALGAVAAPMQVVATSAGASTIYAASNVGPLKSLDSGLTWQTLPVSINNSLLQGIPNSLAVAVDPQSPQTVYITANFLGSTALLKSVDGGTTWTAFPQFSFQFMGNSGSGSLQGALQIDPIVTSTIYSLAQSNGGNEIVRSKDGGATWAALKLPNTPSYPAENDQFGTPATSFAVSPKVSGLIYAVAGQYIFKSADFGTTWNILSTGILKPDSVNAAGGSVAGGPELNQLFLDPGENQVIYATVARVAAVTDCPMSNGGECGLWKSSDNGATWTDLSLPSSWVGSLAFSTQSGTIYAGAYLAGLGSSILKTVDAGTTWIPIKDGFYFFSPEVRTDPNNSSDVYAINSTGESFYESVDAGQTWASIDFPLGCLPGTNCGVDANVVDFIVAAATSSAKPASGVATIVSAATSLVGPVAPGSIASAYGVDLATASGSSSTLPLPISLEGTSANIVDASGVTTPVPLFFVSPGQVNFYIPAEIAEGLAQITITSSDGTSSVGNLTVAAVAPGLFVLNGGGLVAANSITVNSNGTIVNGNDFQLSNGTIIALPISLAPPAQQVYLVLYGTGIAGRSSLANVSAKIAGMVLPVIYAGPQGDAGLDQINVQVPLSLRGLGDTTVTLIVDGVVSNTTHITFE